MRFLTLAAFFCVSFSLPLQAQTLTPEDIAKLVDKRVSDLNPYQALLNDPDPERSLAAMQIMLESGDPNLTRMALEYGLLSPNPTVKRLAFKSWVSTGPILSIRFDGSTVKDNDFGNLIRGSWDGNLSDTVGYWRIAVAGYLEDKKCYANTYRPNQCFLTVNSDGIFLTADYMNARAVISDAGQLEGAATLTRVDEPVPFTIQLID